MAFKNNNGGYHDIYWGGAYQGKGDMSDGNVWGQGGGLWSTLVLYGIIYLIYGLYTSWVLGDLII